MFETLRQLISVGGYRLDDMLLRIDTMYASGRLDKDERAQLIDLAQTNADQYVLLPSLEERVSNLEERVSSLENAGKPSPGGDDDVPEWVRPTSKDTMYNKGDVVMFNGKKYQCVKNNVSTSPEEDSSRWKEVQTLGVVS